MMKKNIFQSAAYIIIVLFISLNSCQVTNKYTPPETSSSDLFREETPTDTTSIADISWKEYFADSLLQNLISEGLVNNFDLKIAVTRIRQAEANLGIARAAYFPNVALVGQVTDTRNMDGSYSSDQFTLGIGATWELDVWGKLNRQSRARKAQFLNSYEYRNLVQTSLIANVATSYYSLMALDEQLRITKETVGLLKETVSIMQDLKDAGQQNGAAVEQSKALRYSTQILIPDLENRIRQTENSICALIGRNPGTVLRAAIHDQDILPQMDHGVPAQMLAKRPDVRQAELSFRSAFELTNVAQASFYPAITLNSGSLIGYNSTTLSDFFKPANIFANIIGGLTQPLFARKQLTGNLKIAKAQQEEALLTFQKTVLNAGREVSDILYGYQSSLSKNDVRTKQIESLSTSVYFTQELLKAGEATYTEVLSSERDLLTSKLGQVNDKLEQLQYSVNLYKALGGGLK